MFINPSLIFRVILICGIAIPAAAGELHMAAKNGDISKIKLLLSEGDSPDERNTIGKTALEIANQYNQKEAAGFLSSITQKKYLSGSRYVGQSQLRLEHGWGVYFASTGSKYTGYFKEGKFHGFGMWHYADGTRYIGEFRDGSFHEEDKKARVSFDVAVQKGSVDAVIKLLSLGEDVNGSNKAGQRPLHFAAFEGNIKIMNILIAGGAIIEIEDENNQRPLHYASYMGHDAAVELLLERGADINCKNKYGLTPLHYAVYQDSVNVAKILLAHGASVYKRDNYGMTPIKHAIKLERKRMLKLLQEFKY